MLGAAAVVRRGLEVLGVDRVHAGSGWSRADVIAITRTIAPVGAQPRPLVGPVDDGAVRRRRARRRVGRRQRRAPARRDDAHRRRRRHRCRRGRPPIGTDLDAAAPASVATTHDERQRVHDQIVSRRPAWQTGPAGARHPRRSGRHQGDGHAEAERRRGPWRSSARAARPVDGVADAVGPDPRHRDVEVLDVDHEAPEASRRRRAARPARRPRRSARRRRGGGSPGGSRPASRTRRSGAPVASSTAAHVRSSERRW